MPRGKPFKKGEDERRGTGGARENSGRPPNDFKDWLGNLVHSHEARLRFEKIVKDHNDADEIVTSEGVQVPHRAKAQVYLQAMELGWSYNLGKPNQPIELNDGKKRPSAEDISAALTILRASIGRGTRMAEEE